ncbi:MAG TPA: hypothetical protein VJY35_02480, partial [Candidatus Eisenbacteria bacterium]|nr:hypothetical protein [Candidatus Eisenbacteria bacterium]
MKQRDIGFRELLERVLPLEDLAPADRSRVQRALNSGIARDIESAALSTIERLAEGGALRRVPTPSNGPAMILRFQRPDALELITVHMPGTTTLAGVTAYPRATLPASVLARLDQVRQLLRLDDPTVVANPGEGEGSPGVLGQLTLAGHELLGESQIVFHPAARPADLSEAPPTTGTPAPELPPLDPALAAHAIAHPAALYCCADTAAV